MSKKVLLLTDTENDFSRLLISIGNITVMTYREALYAGSLSAFDCYCLLHTDNRGALDARLREKLETEADNGKRIFAECPGAFGDVYSDIPKNDTRSRLVYIGGESGTAVDGLSVGDLLDDQSNLVCRPWLLPRYHTPILVFREHIIAHTHTNLTPEEIQKDSEPGMWSYGNGETERNVIMTSFLLQNFNRARFAPRAAWQKLIAFLIRFLTGEIPTEFPDPVVRFGVGDTPDFSDDAVFETYRRKTVEDGIRYLSQFLVDSGEGGIREGLRHNIRPDGIQERLDTVRTDCSGEAAGAFRMFAGYAKDAASEAVADALTRFIFGPMVVKSGKNKGLMRWTETAWKVCYQDDAARAVLPALYSVLYFGKTEYLTDMIPVLDFLVGTTAKDGCRSSRTDSVVGQEDAVLACGNKEHGLPSAHYNAYYHAALLLGYLCTGNTAYRDTAVRGLETIMALYPDTKREQSETEELCRLILPLALLYRVTGEEKHKAMLYRVTGDLQRFRHPFGGYCEWDTGYQANCSRESTGECSVLTENGDPIADLLYSSNWLPLGFAFSYAVTKDELFRTLWRESAVFFIKTQMHSENPLWDGGWCRAFDMSLCEAYANPHDAGWAALSSETGWTVSEILMGLMMPEFLG